ncbi:imidazole glycerol phosphate synthase subunit HisH [Ferruginibacter yonginensis]|uniref:Imidazole glycerol phosphate synthase subunit HisH n=1 Tax=Ferruginibacter yonginensis TaxID=1310416 RepID=A0ABV8QNR7_9BACT
MIAIIKYNAGNITSVSNAVNRLGYKCIVTDDVASIQQADKVIFPGVGEAHSAMQYLVDKGLDEVIKNLQQPVLGICLGLQLMCNFSEEGNTTCMGIFNSSVVKFTNAALVPHMGWNNISNVTSSIIPNNTIHDYYFVHSYYAALCENTTAVCDYIVPFSAALQKNNFYATQFHPEKSADAGAIILKNFLAL